MTPSADPAWGALSRLPGHPMMWILILSELLVFGAFLVAFAAARALDPAGFAASQALLDPLPAGINTLVLVTSGLLAALAVRAAPLRPRACRALLGGAMLLGLVFIAIKLAEYAAKWQAGVGIETDTFFTLYFLVTGFHLLHVPMGIAVLALVAWRAAPDMVETGAAFWHMIDLVWLVLFPVFYLVR